ncbi:ATP-binding protein [Halobaculum sp. D14]|uniref:ATP-binding protein n=1 Tax=Halobaculum sp. D14 TaxID=3421642 RepID=UPI003EC0FA51
MTDSRWLPDPGTVMVTVGVALAFAAAVHHWREVLALHRSVGPLAAVLLTAALALGVVYAGRRLSASDLSTDQRWRVCAWSLGGSAVFFVVIGSTLLIRVFEGRVVTEPEFPLLVSTAAGALAGCLAGYNNVLAWQEAERAETASEQLADVNRELEASNERLERFAYALSHDLQEPLRMVSSYLELLDRRYGDELDDDAREFIDYAVDGADRMQTMVTSLLEYARVTADEEPLEPTDADAVLDGVLDDLRLRTEETDAEITSDDLPTVKADAEQLAQVFRNLVSNAIRHSGDDPPRIQVGAERAGDRWEFSVSDDGVGIPPEHHDRIFELFEQVDAGDAESGTAGMGLALCQRVVERHGGELDVESTPGEGATFSFTLPAVDADGD